MFRKLMKYFLSLTLISGIIATIYYFYKNNTSEELSDDFISEDTDSLDLDSDLEPITKREYVPLNRTPANSDEVKEA